MAKLILINTIFLLINLSSLAKENAPIIFVHGLAANSKIYESNKALKKIFALNGYQLHIANIPSIIDLTTHSEILYKEIRRIAPKGKFHLIGHSMGGIISRKVLHDYDLQNDCLSLTTIATPHQGSVIADWAMIKINDPGKSFIEKVLVRLITGNNPEAIPRLTRDYMKNYFNPQYPDFKSVRYFSLGFFIPEHAWKSTYNPLITIAHKIQTDLYNVQENDGFVSTQSANRGEYLGSFKGDHFSETVPFNFDGEKIYKDVFVRIIRNLKINF
jgi:triacylglycerol lipase